MEMKTISFPKRADNGHQGEHLVQVFITDYADYGISDGYQEKIATSGFGGCEKHWINRTPFSLQKPLSVPQ